MSIFILMILTLSSIAMGQPVTRGLSGCWHVDESSGDIADDCSAGNHDLQLQTPGEWTSGANCKLNGCLGNTGTNNSQYGSTSSQLSTFGSASTFSVSLWVKITGVATVENDATAPYNLPPIWTDNSFFLGVYWGKLGGSGQPEAIHAYNWDTNADVVSSGAYTQGTLVHIAYVHGSGNLRLYVNGVEQTAGGSPKASGNTNNGAATGTIQLFSAALSTACTACYVDEVYFYNVELTPTEVGILAGTAVSGKSKRAIVY